MKISMIKLIPKSGGKWKLGKKNKNNFKSIKKLKNCRWSTRNRPMAKIVVCGDFKG